MVESRLLRVNHFSICLAETAVSPIFRDPFVLSLGVNLSAMKPARLYRHLAELPTYVAASVLGPSGTHLRSISVKLSIIAPRSSSRRHLRS